VLIEHHPSSRPASSRGGARPVPCP
jgi:hypothetical protein